MPKNQSSAYILYGLAAIVVVLLIVFAANNKGGSVGSEYKAFAQCLTEQGAKNYTAYWCPNCQNQKALFGKAWKEIDSKECAVRSSQNNLDLCEDEDITAVPTWEFGDGSRVTGSQSLEFLSERTGCSLDGTLVGDGITVDSRVSESESMNLNNEGVIIELDESASDSGITIEGISVE